ncbi:ribosomal protein S18-alanine N-acetyltransferase [Terriglobus aquaticus]|uniref:[Ribosomal protein bS18]-alanine N-acetyltransferase n=1 Tax=Terriglobus aquaticus TaxID=940139 RepID=A0ABW9KJC7_9BACT|nr:ribosomal protein S18-alanine N-acetyltransferase [Terriglobus aquaticus]
MLREATAADTGAVLALIRADAELPQWDSSALAVEAARAQDGPLRRLLVAELDAEIVGFAQTSLLLGEAELESMAVATACRRQGVGGRLLRRAIELARADGAEVLRLEVRRSNSAARALYESAGMVMTGTRRQYYPDPVEDAVLMTLRWSPSPAAG